MTRPYSKDQALQYANQPVVKLWSPLAFSVGATANSHGIMLSSKTLSNGARPNYLIIAPEQDCRFDFNVAVDASNGGVLRANQIYTFGIHTDVTYLTTIQTSAAGLAHLTFCF